MEEPRIEAEDHGAARIEARTRRRRRAVRRRRLVAALVLAGLTSRVLSAAWPLIPFPEPGGALAVLAFAIGFQLLVSWQAGALVIGGAVGLAGMAAGGVAGAMVAVAASAPFAALGFALAAGGRRLRAALSGRLAIQP